LVGCVVGFGAFSLVVGHPRGYQIPVGGVSGGGLGWLSQRFLLRRLHPCRGSGCAGACPTTRETAPRGWVWAGRVVGLGPRVVGEVVVLGAEEGEVFDDGGSAVAVGVLVVGV